MTGDVHQLRPETPTQYGGSNGGGNGKQIHGRLVALETELKHLATKEDIKRVEKLISDRESIMLKWLIGIIATAVISLVVVLIRTFIS